MRVVFLGNHTVGCRVLDVLGEMSVVAGVVAHPPDPEDGVRYLSVYDCASQRGWPVVRAHGRAPELAHFVAKARADLLWITDYRYLLPAEIVALSPLGAINLHPSLLPRYRGRASINWAILHGETELGLTAHFVDAGMDTGDIIEQVSYTLTPAQNAGDALEILYPLYAKMTRMVLAKLQKGPVERRPQDESQASAFPRRRPEDGLIDWRQPAIRVANLIRAVAHPYPGAFTTLHGKRLTIWQARIAEENGSRGLPGQVMEINHGEILVQCGSGMIALTRVEAEETLEPLTAGCGLG